MQSLASLPLLITPEELQASIEHPKLLILDLSSAEHYQQGHIPGAIHLDAKQMIAGTAPAPGKLPSKDQLQAMLRGAGFDGSQHVVVYDDEGGPWAGRFIWTLELVGHRQCSFLVGALQAWQAAGLPLQQAPQTAIPSTIDIQLELSPLADKAYILDTLERDDHVVWDARSGAEYRGEKVLAARGGHIPGAINFEWTDAMPAGERHSMRGDLAEHLERLGITPDKTVITHCQTHRRSGFTYLALRALGYPKIKAYDGSWSEWGNCTDTPIEL